MHRKKGLLLVVIVMNMWHGVYYLYNIFAHELLLLASLLIIKYRQLGRNTVLPPFQIISHSKNLRESKFFKFDQIYITK